MAINCRFMPVSWQLLFSVCTARGKSLLLIYIIVATNSSLMYILVANSFSASNYVQSNILHLYRWVFSTLILFRNFSSRGRAEGSILRVPLSLL